MINRKFFLKVLLLSGVALAVVLGMGLTTVSAESLKWETDLVEAQAKAKKEGKKIYLLFTGSNWCPGCIVLDRRVHRDREFARYVEEKLVLLKADFPRPNRLPETQQVANERLAIRYQVDGFPTVVVLDSAGKELGRLAYGGGDGEMWIKQLEQVGKGGVPRAFSAP